MHAVYVITLIVIFACFVLIIVGLLTRPTLRPIAIDIGIGTFNKQCLLEKVQCNTNTDCLSSCSEAQSGVDMACQQIPPVAGLTPTQQSILGVNGVQAPSYCVPAKATMSCNVANGGIPVFSGWSSGDDMSFDCLCSYPLWAAGRTCTVNDDGNYSCVGSCELNPGICSGGTFNWDLTKNAVEPVASLCECADGDALLIDTSGLPRCVPSQNVGFYSDLDLDAAITQQMVSIDSVPISSLNPNIPCPSSTYTTCSGGCCLFPNAVCCGTGCCPAGYECGSNNECIKTTCATNEEVCGVGCCPITNGKCCSDGLHCCPPNLPMCDSANNACNPAITPLTQSKPTTGQTACPLGTCELFNAVCCGEGAFCCPSDYPVCDVENGMCSQT